MSAYAFIREKLTLYRNATDSEILFCLNDHPFCAFAAIHRQLDLPFAKREARRRNLL